MRILLDTNVLLDFLLAREPFATDARAIWVACEQGRCTGYAAAMSITIIWYIGRRQVGAVLARQYIDTMLTVLQICAIDATVLEAARLRSLADFEDAVQTEAAIASGLELIVTRNGADFVGVPLPVLTPAEFLARLNQPTDMSPLPWRKDA